MATGNSPTPAAPLWHNRDYMLLWGGQVICTLGSRAASIIYPLLILVVPNSPGASGVAAALRALPYLLFSLPVGALVDRWNRKNGMIICDLLRAMVVLTIRLALWFDLLTMSRRVTGSQWPPWCSRTGPSTPHFRQDLRRTAVAIKRRRRQQDGRRYPVVAQHRRQTFDRRIGASHQHRRIRAIGMTGHSHALTFAQAMRELLPADSPQWPRGLLQMALFVGRNRAWLEPGLGNEQALARWQVGDEEAFDRRCRAQLLDHGQGVDIFAVHWLKTWSAVRDSVADGLSPSVRDASLAAVNRLFGMRFKQHHARRNAQQALSFVAREA